MALEKQQQQEAKASEESKPLADENKEASGPPIPSTDATPSCFTPKRYFLMLLPREFVFGGVLDNVGYGYSLCIGSWENR